MSRRVQRTLLLRSGPRACPAAITSSCLSSAARQQPRGQAAGPGDSGVESRAARTTAEPRNAAGQKRPAGGTAPSQKTSPP